MNSIELVAWVARVSLATISTWDHQTLVDIGWLNNGIVDKLYKLGSTGLWVARELQSSGWVPADQIQTISAVMAKAAEGHIGSQDPGTMTPVQLLNSQRRIILIPMNTDGAGAKAATAFPTPPSGYYPVVRLKRLISTVADASTELNFTVSAGALVGHAQRIVAIVAGVMLDLGGDLLYDVTDDSIISVAIAAGPITSTIWLEAEYWFET